MSDRGYNVLFLCTANSARSIIAEAIMRKVGEGRFMAFSAGSRPSGVVNPFALRTLANRGYEVSGLRSKSWEEFAASYAPKMDFVFTVCSSAAGEACPIWPGKPVSAHWGIADPAAVQGDDAERLTAFDQAFRQLHDRVQAFAALSLDKLDPVSLGLKLRAIGALDMASSLSVKAG